MLGLAELGDIFKIVCVADHRTNRDGDDIDELVPFVIAPWIRQVAEVVTDGMIIAICQGRLPLKIGNDFRR